ncbi:alpha-glucosidase-like [Oppia nitens]|uniref:alpha-glucosidase-like n=1 Tax=Oppia nitens TaxID=1686743 RepID=UPI0023DBE9BA|nr:alpha-glucosidase-like [Oppia nitens]
MASELHLSHLSDGITFGQTTRFTKGVSFQVLDEMSEDCYVQNNMNIAMNCQPNPNLIVSNGTVISKSSSSDSDTNDSATRLLEDSIQDFQSMRYLLLSTPTTTHTTTTCLNENPSNGTDVLWTQMQNSISKDIRSRYLSKRKRFTRDYTLCYFSAFKTVFSVTLCILICCLIVLMTIIFIWRHKHLDVDTIDDHMFETNWWRRSTFYEIFVSSFKDSDGDGFGDFNGLRDKIYYFKELGVNAVRLNSIFSALDYPHRYDNVLDFYNVDPHLGKMNHFLELVKELHKSKIYIILDINIVWTSDQHPWAAHYLLNRSSQSEYQYFYVNVSGDQLNDEEWTSSSATDRLQSDFIHKNSHFGGRLHLNWSHPGVHHKMFQVIDYWLKYIDGFYLKRLEHMYVDNEATLYDILNELRLRANLVVNEPGVGVGAHKVLICSHSFVQKRHKLLLNYMRNPLAPNDMTVSTNTATNGSHKHLDINSYFDVIDVQLNIDINKTETIRDQVNAIFLNSPAMPWIHWSVGDVERSRLATRIGSQYTMTVSFLLMMLPGTVSWFYGDEIALQDTYDPITQKEYRGGQLCPMPWMSTLYANFTQSNTSRPWLPIHPNYTQINVLKQNESIKRFNELLAFRSDYFEIEEMGKHGNYLFHYIDDNQLVLERYFDRGDPPDTRFRYILFANFGLKPKIKDFSDKFHFSRIKISSVRNREKEFLYMKFLRLDAGEAIIVEVD